jgi:subtilisin family serine protease
LTAVAAVAAAGLLRSINLRHGTPARAGAAHLFAYGGRSLQQRSADGSRLDAALADIARHASGVRPASAIADLHALNPAARFRQATSNSAPEVLVDAATRGDPQQLKAALVALGLEHPSVFANAVGGWLPVSAITAVAARPEVAFIHASMPHKRSVGPVATQGDFVQGGPALRATYPSLTGAGVTVGVVSDSYDCYAAYAQSGSGVPASGLNGYASNGFTATAEDDVASGALPAGVRVLAEPYNGNCLSFGAPQQLPFSDEGRAMMQVVHVVAPGASLAFYTGDNSETDFANGILKLASAVSAGGAGAQVIADDLGYFDEPFYQDGVIAQAIDTVAAQGVAYFSAAGNNGDATYENKAPSFATLQPAGSANNANEYLLNFDTSGATTATSLPIHLEPLVPGEFVAIVVEWDQPYITGAPNSGGATSQIDLCVTGATAGFYITNNDGGTATCTGLNATGGDSYQLLVVGNPADATANTAATDLDVVVGLGASSHAPNRILVAVETDGQTTPAPISAYATNSASIQGHPGAAGAAAVAAAFYYATPACGTSPAEVESYSSLGGAPILFDSSGNRLATPIVRQKPNFVGPDGVNNTFLGFQLQSGDVVTSIPQCQTNLNLPSFFGTSAATPHAAGIAALMLQANSAATPTQIISALETSALPIGPVPTTGSNPTYNFTAGYGFIQAGPALAQLPGGPPTLSLSSNAIAAGGTTTITWSSFGAASCTATGSDAAEWSGTLGTSGSRLLTPTPTGILTYSLACTDAASQMVSTGSTVSLSVGLAPPAPILTLGESAIPAGSSTTISWSSQYATSCTASGSWSGTLAANGSQTITASTQGTDTYSLVCTNVVGNSTAASQTLTVNEPIPTTPTLSLSSTAIAVGSTTTITWSSPNATSCTASGSWSGTLAASGTQTLTPTTAGTETYVLTCANASGSSAQASVTLTVAAKPSSGGGGGRLDGLSLWLLGGLTLVGRYRRRPMR